MIKYLSNMSFLKDIFVPLLIVSLTIASNYFFTNKPEKKISARLMFDKFYSKIFELTEDDLYSKDITMVRAKILAEKILQICSESDGYYHPSIKSYAELIINSDENSFSENWMYFSNRFSMRYDGVLKQIGMPRRNSAYRLNHRQYEHKKEIPWLIFKNDWLSIIIYIILVFISWQILTQ